MKKLIKDFVMSDRNDYLVSNLFFIAISTTISLILIASKDISVSGGVILGIFQVFVINTFWLVVEIKFKLEDIGKTRSINDKIIQEFAESELLQNKYVSSLLNDLKFDKNIKKDFHHIKEAHFYMSKLKVETYFNEFFIFNPENKTISDVPLAYFETKIWKKLVNSTPFYYSIQKLSDEFDMKTYLENPDRLHSEINTLTNRTEWGGESFRKLFIIKDEYFDSDKIKKSTQKPKDKYGIMYDYLKEWHEGVGKKKNYPIKVVKESLIVGHQEEDLGIFGNFYGIQRQRNNDEKKIMGETAKIDFYFNYNDTQEKTKYFLEFFKSKSTIQLTDEFFS